MKRLLSRPVAVAGIALSLGGIAAAITITPASQDYGDVAVSGLLDKTFAIGGIARGDSASATLTGPDASHWDIKSGPLCANNYDPEEARLNPGNPALQPGGIYGPCAFVVGFRPKSLGPKVATLVVTDFRGGRVTAALRGKGVAAPCLNKVVFCNYAHLYSGVVRWNSVLKGPTSSTTVAIQIDVVKGVASCNGSETNVEAASGSKRGDITGTGLIAVEFKVDDTNRTVYNITVACPSPFWAQTETDAAIPSRRAELGDYEQQSYDQQADSAGNAVVVGMDFLVGSNSYQDGAADPVNNVDGTVTVSWRLVRQ